MLRFRRWARHSYSVFCSIGKKVTIGHLSSDIVDASLRKDRSIHSGYLSGEVRGIADMIFSGADTGADETPPGEAERLAWFGLLSQVTIASSCSESDCTEAIRFPEAFHSFTRNPFERQLYEDRQPFAAVCPFLSYLSDSGDQFLIYGSLAVSN